MVTLSEIPSATFDFASKPKSDRFRPAQRRLLRAVASIEFIKGVFVLLIGVSAILLVHKDAWVIAESLLAFSPTSIPTAIPRSSFLTLQTTLQTRDCGLRCGWRLPIRRCVLWKRTGYGSSAPGQNGSRLGLERC